MSFVSPTLQNHSWLHDFLYSLAESGHFNLIATGLIYHMVFLVPGTFLFK